MKKCVVAVAAMFLSACASHVYNDSSVPRDPVSEKGLRPTYDIAQLTSLLAMQRPPTELGLVEKSFDSCNYVVKDAAGKCGRRVLSVVNFQLLCRDSEETVSTPAANLTPVGSAQVKWKFANQTGLSRTDGKGYGSVQIVNQESASGQRLVLIVGQQFLGLDISEVHRIVVPIYWCKQS